MTPYINRQLAFWIVCVIHAYWIIALCFSAEPLNTTPLSAMNQMARGSRAVVAIALAVGISGGWWSLYGKGGGFQYRVPQLFMVGATAWADMALCYKGHYADNVERSFWFLSTDQCTFLVIALAYVLTTRRRAA